MNTTLPGVVVTGASGFIGRHFLASAAGKYRLFCLARRSRREAGIPEYDNLRWTQVDIARWDTMRDVVRCIKDHGGADYVVHLAGYYDFHDMENPEYDRTNVLGTRNVLKLARQIGTTRFIFASSLAACEFPAPGQTINEETPPHANFAYARSKRLGEEMLEAHTEYFPASVVRLAAVFSDWCEYPPLYMQLKTWLGSAWNARILGGRGESAVTYIHIQDLVRVLHTIIDQSDCLPRYDVFNASPCQATSHKTLYTVATRYHFGHTPKPDCLPKWFAGLGVCLRWWLGRLVGHRPFEAPWMVHYIDKVLQVDSTRTQDQLHWRPAERLDVQRRLLVMVENMKAHGEIWRLRNEQALQRVGQRPNLVISYEMDELRESIVEQIADFITAPFNRERFCNYHTMPRKALLWFITLVYQVLVTSVRSQDRQLFRNYAQVIATRRKQDGFTADQVRDFLMAVGRLVETALVDRPVLKDHKQHIHDYISLSFQLAADSVEDIYENSVDTDPSVAAGLEAIDIPTTADGLAYMVSQLEDICEDTLPPRLKDGRYRP